MPSTKTTTHQHTIATPTSAVGSNDAQFNQPNKSGLKPIKNKDKGKENQSKSLKDDEASISSKKSSSNVSEDRIDTEKLSSSTSDSSGEAKSVSIPDQGKNKELSQNEVGQVLKNKKKEMQPSRQELKIQQHRKKILLAGCEPSMSLNYDSLAMDDYPSNEEVASAKFERDCWYAVMLSSAAVFAVGFLSNLPSWLLGSGPGLTSIGHFIPAWMSGAAFGICGLSAAFYFGPFRESWMGTKSYSDLLIKRKELEYKALTHIQFLEGVDGLAWRCAKMHKYNSNLAKKLFEGLLYYSKEKNLLEIIRHRKQIRLYLLFMMESQKAYKRLQKDYLENHFKHLDKEGWDDNLSESEIADFEKNEVEFDVDVQSSDSSESK